MKNIPYIHPDKQDQYYYIRDKLQFDPDKVFVPHGYYPVKLLYL